MIWRRVRRGWVDRVVFWLRWSRFAAYLLITLAGVAAIIWPPTSVRDASGGGHVLPFIWAGLMAVSAAFCAGGVMVDRWVGEYIGLIPLAFVALIFGVSALARGNASWSGGLFLLAFFWILVTRWQEAALLRGEALKTFHRRDGGDGGGSRR